MLCRTVGEDFAPRWLNHFYDPVYERGLSTEIPGVNGYLAKNWAQFSSYQTINIGNIINLWTGNGSVISGSEWGDFSYEVAIKNYSQNKEKEAYLALGHVIHLIEDMTVPEHTRNDVHPGGTMVSFYEDWTKSSSSGLTQDLGKRLFNQGSKSVIYSDLASYFNNLADYTNTHFFSPRTIQSEIYAKPKITFEDGTFAYGYDENSKLFDLVEINKKSSYQKDYKLKNPQIMQEYWLRLSRQAIVNGAGAVQLFSNQAEVAKQIELAKQKVEVQQVARKSSFFSSIINFFKNPGENNQPALTITNEPTLPAPKINQTQSESSIANTNPKPVLSQTVNPAPTPVPPKVTMPTLIPIPSPNSTSSVPTPAPAPAPAPVVVYGGGGGGGSSSSNTQQTTNNTQQTTSNAENNSTVQTFNVGDLVVNEIMYNLEGTDDKHEWIEIYNNSGHEIVLTGGSDGWKFNDGADSNHRLNEPATNGSMVMAVGGYAILADDADTFLTDHSGFSSNVIDTVMDLKNSTSTIKIIAPDGMVIDEVTYYNSWGANGNGKTLERKSAVGSSNDSQNWAESSANGGTPGAANNWLLSTSDVDNATGTNISATTIISENTTWTLASSPYRLFFDGQRRPTVAAGAILTIEPGVKVIPQGGNYTVLEIKGMLNAIATSDAPIIFTSISDADDLASTTPQSGEWLNIAFSSGSQGNLDYVEFRYGGQGLERPVKEMVKAIGATININHSKFENSQSIALRLVDSEGVVENSVFSDNACGVSIDSLVNGDGATDGGCYGVYSIFSQAAVITTPQIRNNQFIRNRTIAVEVRDGATPIIDNNIFTDNGYPMRIESSYPAITNSQLTNSTTSPNILNGIAISGHTHFSQDFTLKKDLPYILETNGPAWTPYVDAGATLTLEPGVILKPSNNYSALNINGSLIAQGTTGNPIVFTSFKDDTRGGDTNGDGSVSSPQNGDWRNIQFFSGSIGNFINTIFSYGGYDYIAPPPSEISIENFDSYSVGALSGQGDWGSGNPSGEISVINSFSHDGSNSVKLSGGGGGAYTYRTLTQPIAENGTLSFWIYYNSLGNQGISITDAPNDNAVADVYYDTNHNCSTDDRNCFVLNSTRTAIQATTNIWYHMEIETDFSNHRARMRQDGGDWSDWAIFNGINIGRIRFDRGNGGVFFDTFVYSKPASNVPINPALSIDAGATVVVQ